MTASRQQQRAAAQQQRKRELAAARREERLRRIAAYNLRGPKGSPAAPTSLLDKILLVFNGLMALAMFPFSWEQSKEERAETRRKERARLRGSA